MKSLTIYKVFFAFIFLLITNSIYSDVLYRNLTNSTEFENFNALSVDGISPTSGHAGTVVTITGTGFTLSSTSNVLLGTFPIPSANVEFVSTTQLNVTIPCGVTNGFFNVDGIASTTLFTYLLPTISTTLPNLSYCDGTTVPLITLAGTLTTPTTSTLQFSWLNSNVNIGLSLTGGPATEMPTFTAVNSTLEPITSTITVTPSIYGPLVNGCPGTPKTYTITVNPKPVVTPISNISVCAGVNVNQINLIASSPTTGTGTSFLWSGNNNAAIGLSTPSGTTSPIPAFTVANTTNGLLTSTFTVIPTYQTCVGSPINFTIDVAPLSFGGNLSSNGSICSGSTSGLLTVNGYKGTILNWESSTTGSAPWTSLATTASSFQSAGLTQTTYYRVVVQNPGCPIAYSNVVTITVNSLPIITGNLLVCNGANTSLTGSATPATINPWQSTSLGVASITSLGVVTGVSPGTTVITYTNTNGCSTTANFVVNALPVVFITNPPAVCSPNTVNLNSTSVTTGSTLNLNYTYYTNSIATLPLSNYTAVATSGTFYIKGTDANGCSSVSLVSTLVNSLPTIAISGVNLICTNDTTTLTASGATSFSWNSGLGTNASIDVSPLNTTTYTVNATDNNGCVGTATSTVTVKPLPTVNAGLDRAVCSGLPVTLVGSGTAGTAYTWDNAVLNNVAFTPSASTTYTLTGSGANGCFNTDSVLVTVNALPTAPILNAIQPDCSVATGTIQFSGLPTSGNWTINPGSYNGSGATFTLNNQPAAVYNFSVRDSNLCSSANASITVNAAPIIPAIPTVGAITQPSCATTTGSVVLSGLPIGNWTITQLPGGQTNSNTGTNFPITNLSSGTYTFSVSNGTCSSLSSQNVVIDATPTQSAPIVGLIVQPTCTTPTGSVTLNGLPAGNWTLTRITDGVTLTSSGITKTITGLASGTYNYTVTNSNGCISPISNVIVIDNQPASPPAPIAVAQSFLAAANATVFDLTIVSSGTPTWYANAIGGAAIPSSTLLATGTYYVSQTVNGCESAIRTAVNVTVFPTSSGGSVLGGTIVCSGTNSTLLTLSGYTGSILNWESSTVSDFSSNVQFINVQSATYTATNLTVPLYFRAVVQSGTVANSAYAFIDVVGQSNGGILSSSTAVCLGQNSGLLSVSGYTGTIIRWEQSVNSGSIWTPISNITDTYTSGALLVTTQYRVVVQNGVCPAVTSSVITITVKSTPIVTGVPDQNVCYGNTVSFGNPVATPGYTYEWSSLLGITPNPTTSDYSFTVTQSDFYTYTITNTVTNCSVSDSFSITMKPLPNATVISPTSICEGNSINIGSNSTVGSTYSWTSIPSGFISSSSNPSVNPAVTTTYILEETIAASGCKKSNQTVITVQPIPVITIVGSPEFHICETLTQVQLNASITNLYASYVWTKLIGSGSFDFTNILNPKYSPSAADVAFGSVTLQLSVIGANPCVATYTQNVVIIIDKKPIANAGLDVITCGTTPVQINATGTLNATNLLWSLPSGITGTLNLSNPYIPIFTPSANDVNYVGPIVISLTASSNTTCPSSPDTVSVLITPAPIVDAGPPTVTICEGSNYIVPFNPTAGQYIVNSTIVWDKGTGDGTFSNPNSLTPIYTPGQLDINNGSVTLTLSASGNNPCSTPDTDSIILTIVKNPIVNAGPDTTVCEGTINVNANIQNAGLIVWTVQNGNGNFVDPSAISPVYIPVPSDLNTTVTFVVTVTPINNCGPIISDSVLYTINAAPSVVAAGNATICQSNATYQLQATATNTTSITWTSTGSGSFDNIHNEDPIYTISPGDVNASSVTFTITGIQSLCANVTDTMVLTIQKNPTANAGPAQVICQGDSVVLPGSSTNSNVFSWIRSSGTGIFINDNTTTPTYTSQLTETGNIYLTLIASPISPCTVSASSNTTISIIPKPTADAGNDAQICEGDSYHITTAGATNNIGVQWSTSGDGTFTGGTTQDPTYTPGPSDNNFGSVILTLLATKNAPCFANAVDQMTLTINKIPVVTVINPNVNLCVGDPSYIVTGVVPTNYDTLVWSTSGSGTFSPNISALAPIYFPSASDYTLGTVTLTLTASRNPLNCNSSTSNTITLHFIKKPTVDAGPVSASICEGSFYVTNGAIAANHSNVTWSTSGSGTFINATTFLATYTPSAADYNLGFVNLTLTANPLTPCAGTATDVIRLDLQKIPVITVRANDTICFTQNTYQIGGTSVVNYIPTSVVWTTSGTGTFSPTIDPLNPIYNPSTDDFAFGFVTLTITVNSISPCINQASKSFVLSFQKLPVASAGPTIIQCDTPFKITTATAILSTVSSFIWSTSGTGTFDYTNILDPIYTPSTFDVQNSPITLTLTANAIAPCTVASVTTVQLNIVNSPVITVTPVQATICEDATNVTVLGTTVLYASNYIWTSATGTTISNNTLPNPIVTPSAQDITNNQIVLTITAQPVAPCGVSVSKQVTIPIQKKPSVFAGTSQTICENTIITTSDALSSNVTNLHWDSNGGDGIFTTSNLNTITEYTPGINEIANGQVLLTLIGDAIAPCSGTITSTITYTIIKNPIVTINPTEVTICETQTTYTVPSTFVTLLNPSSILNYQWTTPNMASLTGASTWTPTYTPTAADIATGFVYLTLTVNPILPCATPIVKTLKINISKQATITFTNDGFFCENISKPLSATFVNYDPNSISWTIVNGTGSITGGDTATPTYVPASDSGTVVIRISVASLAPCTNTVTQDFTITVVKKPIVSMTTTTDTVCSSQLTYNLSGNTTQFANSILWTRENPVGTGTFSDATILNPVYTFNAADIANGFVTLRLTASSTANCGLTDFKEITINITKAPTVVTAPTDSVCQGSVFSASATSTNRSSVLWSTVGTSNGLFANANQPVTQYTPGSNDVNSFIIQVTAYGNAPCAAVSATKVVQVQPKPILDAGIENRYNCSSQPYQITGVTGQNLGTILWSSNSGAPGTFSNASGLNPSYTPSLAELNAGLPIILTVTAQAVAPCLGSVSDFIILNLTPNQIVDAGTYPSICEGSSVSLIGNVINTVDVNWTSSGTGTFSAVNSINTDYVPSSSDIIIGTVTLTLHATSNSNCPEVTDTTVITIKKKPIANAGANVSICQGSSYTLSAGDASAQNYSSITWTATGPGVLNLNPINPLTPTYVPVIGQTGIVTLTLTATGYSECGINAVSLKTITIVPSPFATIPSTKTICEGETLTLSNTDASAINYSSLLWSSSNLLGSFTPNNAAATIYTPALGQTGIVTLSLTANSSNGVCPSYVSSLLLDIIAKPVVEAGTNGTICQSQSFAVTGASVQNSTLYSWSVSGPATIQSGTGIPNVFPIIPPVIIPNAGASGTVTVTLTAVGIGICPVVISDFLTIQINPIIVVNAGTDGALCEGIPSFQLNGTVSNANSYTWTTTGGGTIQQTANPLAPLYIPSASDFSTSTGVKIITINLNATTTNGCSAVSNTMQLTLYAKPKINAGLDLLGCQNFPSVHLFGASVSNYNSGYNVSWSSSGNGTWDYTGSPTGINPHYIFGSNDTSSVTLTMSALPNSVCPQVAVTDTMVITIQQNPTIAATSNEITMCGETFTMPDLVTVNNGNSILWTNTTGVSGTPGVLTNATTETPIFTPSANEITNGFALLTLTAQPLSGCSIAAVTVIKVNLQPKAIVNAGANITACQGEIITLNNGASVQNYITYSWSENGTGTIAPATINTLNPTYTPGVNETGVITFALQATNKLPCAGLVTQTMTVTISSQPTVNAGPDATICQNSNYTLATATVANNTTVLWTSSQNSNGTSSPTYAGGSFTNTTIINPTYTPSLDDINLGYVYLTVKANSTLCSSLVSDVIKITISKEIGVAAGSDATICEGTNFTLVEATSSNATSYVWTSSQNSNGTSSPTYVSGSFSSATLLNPIYTPSLDDINLGHVYLTLTGSGNTICPNNSSQILLNIIKKPTVSTTDVQMCMSTPQVSLLGVATNYESFNWSIYSGPGSISPNPVNPLNPTFISGISGLTTVQTTVVRLYVTPKAGCPQSSAVYDDLVITIQPLPTVEAGINGSVCYTSGQPIAPFAINGTSVTNASSQNWTSSVPGIFYPGSTVLYQSLSNICSTEILTLTANGNGACSTNTVSDTVTLTVNCSVPSLGTISGISTICQGATASYIIPANSNIQSYTWSTPTGVIIQSGQGTNNIQVLFTTTATSGNITVTGTNGCGSVIATLPITVNSLPTGVSISGPQSVCVGDTNVVYVASTIPNATSYTWSVPSGVSILSGQGTNSIQVLITSTATSGNVSVIGNNTCGAGTVSSAFPIIINPQPSLSSSLTPPAICSGAVFNYVPTSLIAGTTFAWTRATQIGISNLATSGSGSINEILINTTTNPVSVSYQITMTSILGCSNIQTVVVVVNPAPSLTSIAPPAAICSGSVFNYTPTTASSGTITWVRNAVSGIVEGTSNGNGIINETLTNSTTLPITVTYLLTIPATANGCSSATATQINLIVNPSPQVAVNSINLCFGTSQLITATLGTSGTYSYAWTVPSGVLNPGNSSNFSVNTAGTYSVIITNTTTLCSSASASGTVTIVPLPIVAINSETICAGTTTTLLASPSSVGNYTYTWTVPTGVINPGNATSITSGVSGIYGVSIKDITTNCISLFAFGTITVNPLPIVSVNNPFTCAGSTATVTATPSTLGTFTYAWTVPMGTGNPGNVASFSTLIGGVYSVIITNTVTTCSSVSASGTVTLNPIPTVTVNSASICAGLNTTISATPGFSGNYSYVWTVPIGVTNPGNVVSFSASVAGTYSVIITNTITNCISSSASGIITVNPIPLVTVNNGTVCAGFTTTLNATPNPIGNYTYTWTVPTGAINPGNASSITSGVSGIYGVSIKDTTTNCISLFAFGTITVNPLPIVSVNNPFTCAGANATVIATPSTLGTYTYAWTVPTGAGNPGDVASFSTSIGGVYSVIITNTTTTCSSLSASGTVTLNPIPNVTVNSASICAGLSTTISATPDTTGTYSYAWTVPTGVTNPGNVASFSASVAGTYSVIITNTTTLCSSASASGTITIVPLPIVTINSETICAGTTTTLTATPSSFGNYTYTWTVPTGAINPGNATSITSGVSGIYGVSIKDTTTNCISLFAFGTITVNPLPIVSVNNPFTCAGSTATVTATPSTLGTYNYTWTVPTGAGNPGNLASFSTSIGGVYSVIITNTTTTCSSVSAFGTVTVNPIPTVTVNSASICAGLSTTISATPGFSGNYSYVWTVPSGVTNPGNVASFSASVAGTYSVIITNTITNCISSSASGIITVNPIPLVTVNNGTVCAGFTTTLIATPNPLGNYNFAWIVPTGAINPGNSISVIAGIAGNYNVVITDTTTNCSSISAFGVLTVNPLPIVSVNNPSICDGANALVTATPSIVGTYTYSWTVPVGAINPGNTASFSTNIGGVYSVIITNTTTTCSSASASGTVTVNPIPTVSVNNASICFGSSATISATPGFAGNYSFVWTVPVGSNNPLNSASLTASIAGTYSVVITNTATSCVSLIASGILTVNPIPTVTLNSATICAGDTTTLTATPTSLGNYSYLWTVPTGAVNPGNANSITSGIAGTYSVKITDTTTNCSSSITSGSIIINPQPIVSVNSPSICAGANALLTATPSTVGVYSYAWTVPFGVTNPGNVASFTSSVAGNYSVVITNTVTTCFSVSSSGTITVNPLPVVTVNSETICAGSSTTLVATPSLPGTYSYAWIVPAGANNPGNTSNFSASIAGIYSVVITNLVTNCSSTLASGSITVISLPIVNITNPLPICAPNTVDLTTTTTGSSPGLTFGYWNDSSATIAVANPNSVSISGTYYIKGTNAFGCSTVQPVVVIINPSPMATISGQNSFVVCQNGTQPIITFTGSNGTAPYIFSYRINLDPIQTVSSSATSNSISVVIPTSVFGNYTITLLSVQDSGAALCSSSNITLPNSAFVEVQQVGTIIPVNQTLVSQIVCQGNPILPIVFTIGGASTNAFVTNLPAGLNGVYNSVTRTLIISGIPLVSGVFNYVVHTSGSTNGCNSTYGGTITVNSNDSITALTPATINQAVCLNAAIQPIVYSLGGGATGGIVTFSPNTPAGISWSIVSNVLTISGASNTIGTFTYTVQSFGLCGQTTVSGTLTINDNVAVALVSGNPSPTVCSGTSFATPIQYSIASTTATIILSGALPTGVTFNPITGIISGTPTQSGSFPYTITSSTGCGNVLSGVITVNPLQTISYVSGNTNQVACQYSSIDPINFIVSAGVNAITISPALPAGISYIISGGILTISGTPTSATSLAQNFTITTQGTCGPQAIYSVTFDIRPEATITLISGSGAINQAVCQSSAIVPIRFTIGGGASGIVIPTLPAGLTLTLDPLTGIYTIQGNPLVNGIFNFPITTTGCPKTIFITISNVNSAVGITLTSAHGTDNQTLCQTNFNSPIVPIVYTIIGATSVNIPNLPVGVIYVFSPTTGQLIISGTPLQAGIFNYTITSLPCSIVKAGVIRVSTPMFITNEVVTNVSCSSNNDGAISVTIVGGVSFNGLYAVHWSGPNGFQQNQTTITGLQAGDYVLTGTDAIGCPIPTMTYTVLPAQPINIALQSSTNVSCNGILGCANFNITGGSGIYTSFTLQYLDPSSQTLVTIMPANNNYFNICNLNAGLYYLTVKDSKNCSTAPYLFTIYDYSSLSIESITLDDSLCQDTPGKIRVIVNSLDPNLTFYYNSVLVPFVALGNNTYEVSIDNPTVPNGIIKVKNGQDCWVTETVSTAIITPDFSFTSNDFQSFGYYSVNGSVQFTNLVNMSSIPAEYDYIVWDFGDNTPFKVFYNPADLLPNAAGENFETVFHTYTTNGIYQITLTVYNQFGCFRTVTKTIIIGSGATMMLPTIFTPNNDGINDLFRPSLIGLKDVAMYIYDDWGNLVYEVSSEVSLLTADWGWNGIEKGQTEPRNNDYRYYIIATTINDKKLEKEGRFLLVK